MVNKIRSDSNQQSALQNQVVKIIFISLMLDLLAFTMPLPLFPRLIASFVDKERNFKTHTVLSRTLELIRACRTTLTWSSRKTSLRDPNFLNWDITFLGGLLGSVFSLCQFLVSPFIGAISDTYGRRPVLLLTMVGNILSALIWLFSTTFGTYLLSRTVGGLSEGNVQLSIAIISDVSEPATRAKSLAMVGIAFSLCFTLGPSLGAWFASKSPPPEFPILAGVGLNVYAAPAAISLMLLVIETFYIWLKLPETKEVTHSSIKIDVPIPGSDPNIQTPIQDNGQPQKRLTVLKRIHTLFLFFFSGAEFTLTFRKPLRFLRIRTLWFDFDLFILFFNKTTVTYDLYGFTNIQNGRLLGFIGVLSSLLQGGYTRRSKKQPISLLKSGIKCCVLSFILLSALPSIGTTGAHVADGILDRRSAVLLYSAVVALAYVSASVVNSLNTLASLECDERGVPRITRGKVLGNFRAAGQLGRAFGPLFATTLYWAKGPSLCYGVCGMGALGTLFLTKHLDDRAPYKWQKEK